VAVSVAVGVGVGVGVAESVAVGVGVGVGVGVSVAVDVAVAESVAVDVGVGVGVGVAVAVGVGVSGIRVGPVVLVGVFAGRGVRSLGVGVDDSRRVAIDSFSVGTAAVLPSGTPSRGGAGVPVSVPAPVVGSGVGDRVRWPESVEFVAPGPPIWKGSVPGAPPTTAIPPRKNTVPIISSPI